MAVLSERKEIGFLSTYSPRECGLATFTEDLVKEISKIEFIRASVIAVSEEEEQNARDHPLARYKLNQYDRPSYRRAASWANDHLDLLVVEHEYGIYGGECGEYLMDLARALKIPFIVTTHTVLAEPSSKQREILRDLGKLGAKVVTMAESSIPILVGTYGICSEKIAFIPHGVPSMYLDTRENLKKERGFQDKKVMSSFGLMSPAKGIEYGIKAAAKVIPDYENLIYLILGKTHPRIKESMGESYRRGLMDLAQNLGIRDNVRFIDQYLTQTEVMTYLYLSDMYLTPYLSKEQAVSGTLAYAVGCGRVVISTPYRYAEEMLKGGRGLLARFNDADSIASCIRTVLGDPGRQAEMEKKTLLIGRSMTWAAVAEQYARLFALLAPPKRPSPPARYPRFPAPKIPAPTGL